MATSEHETKAFMTAYKGLKGAASALEGMSHEAEPDLDKMLIEVKRAKEFYDQCNQVIENIKAQVDSIFSGSAPAEPEFGQPTELDRQKEVPAALPRVARPTASMDDEIPF